MVSGIDGAIPHCLRYWKVCIRVYQGDYRLHTITTLAYFFFYLLSAGGETRQCRRRTFSRVIFPLKITLDLYGAVEWRGRSGKKSGGNFKFHFKIVVRANRIGWRNIIRRVYGETKNA